MSNNKIDNLIFFLKPVDFGQVTFIEKKTLMM